MTFDQFKERFVSELQSEQQQLKANQLAFKAQSREDEAKFAVIEANVVDIFTKMFAISCSKTQAAPEWQGILKETYGEFFIKIPAPWSERLAQCEAFDLAEEAHIERLKLQRAETILQAFNTLMAAI